MSDEPKRWQPHQWLGLWMPTIISINERGQTVYGVRDGTGFYSKEACENECEKRNSEIIGAKNAIIDRLERQLAEARAL